MGSSAGRRSAAYVRTRRRYQTGNYPCAMQLPGCTGTGTTVGHDPPLSTVTDLAHWHGRYIPACPHCQSLEGATIVNARRKRWTW